MSKYSFIVSNSSLPEIDLTGMVKMKYGEYKKLNIQPKNESIINLLDDEDDEIEILYVADPAKMHDLKIILCTNRPYGLEEYIKKEYIYWMEGSPVKASWNEQLYDYLKGVQHVKDELEIWSIWFGDGPQEIEDIKLRLLDLKLSDLELLKRINYCIKFE
ncbi:hypothetical protein MNQ98_21375 [Paenibacillus sp. N3/727]|uniref:hypothetical protein n=1 Tax=Paenibacillus sp. N3/727 TaxID=2925845 RepID=UPI001F532495|nr:hypothetical protein [Paenibacillus sp. N3/727]UNK17017.1 hypothetical protein MNQ98_21375 [Paenibacillus sp. N3/727]